MLPRNALVTSAFCTWLSVQFVQGSSAVCTSYWCILFQTLVQFVRALVHFVPRISKSLYLSLDIKASEIEVLSSKLIDQRPALRACGGRFVKRKASQGRQQPLFDKSSTIHGTPPAPPGREWLKSFLTPEQCPPEPHARTISRRRTRLGTGRSKQASGGPEEPTGQGVAPGAGFKRIS
jgi:hypothetical protein